MKKKNTEEVVVTGLLDVYKREIAKIPRLKDEEVTELAKRIEAGDREAMHKLVTANLGLLFQSAIDYHKKCQVPVEDLIQEGFLGLWKAAERFDYRRGFKFSTLAVLLIRQAMSDMIPKYRNVNVQEVSMEDYKYKNTDKHGILTIAETIGDKNWETKFSIEELLGCLPKDVDREVVRMFLEEGESWHDRLAFEDIGRQKNITAERARQIVTRNYEILSNGLGKSKDSVPKNAETGGHGNPQTENTKSASSQDAFYRIGDDTIVSGYTKQLSESVAVWADVNNTSGLRDWEDFYQIRDTADLLEKTENVVFYRYFVSYLVSRFGQEAACLAERHGIDVSHLAEDVWQEKLKDVIYSEIEKGRKAETDRHIKNGGKKKTGMMPSVKYLAQVIAGELAQNGYAAGDSQYPEKMKFRGSLSGENRRTAWGMKKIEGLVCSEKVQEKDFLNLAVGMGMSAEDTDVFLKKVFLRDSLNLFDKNEAVTYMALKYAAADKQQFIDQAMLAYDQAEAAAPGKGISEDYFNTEIYRNQVDTLVEAIEKWMLHTEDPQNVMAQLKKVFGYMKYMAGENGYQRTAVKEFLRLRDELERLTKNDRKHMVAPALADREENQAYTEGEVRIVYDCTKGLSIGKNHIFMKKNADISRNKGIYRAITPLDIEEKDSFDVVIPVACTEETEVFAGAEKKNETGHVEKGQIFTCDLPYFVKDGVRNKSMFKANGDPGSRTRITGKLTARCDALKTGHQKTEVLKGTVFVSGGFKFVSTEPVALEASAVVRVRGQELAKLHEITDMADREKFSQIMGIDNTRISLKNAGAADRVNPTQYGITHKLTGAMDRYLYMGAFGQNIYGMKLEKTDRDGHLREKLLHILEGTDIDFANRTRAALKAGTGEQVVTRNELMTLAFLVQMAKMQFSDQTGSGNRVIENLLAVNHILSKCGFFEVYPVNPYDSLMLYITSFEREPLYVFRNLWATLQDYAREKNNSQRTV